MQTKIREPRSPNDAMILMSTNITYVVDMQSNFMNTFLNGWTQLLISWYSVGSLLDCYNIGRNVFTLIVKSVPHGNLNFNLDAIKIHDVQHQMTPPSKAELLRIHRLLNRYIRSLGIPVAKSILQSPMCMHEVSLNFVRVVDLWVLKLDCTSLPHFISRKVLIYMIESLYCPLTDGSATHWDRTLISTALPLHVNSNLVLLCWQISRMNKIHTTDAVEC